MHMRDQRAAFCRGAVLAALAFVLIGPAGVAAVDYPGPTDRDNDGIADTEDRCAATPGDLKNGCPSELNAEVRGRWRVNAVFTQLLSLTVRAPTGSRIDVRCSARKGVCDFTRRIIPTTTRRVTGLTRFFKGKRILPAKVTISVRVTRAQRIGVYERVVTRTGRRLPSVTNRCVLPTGTVRRCS
jgi:hypothetical protein